MKDLPALFKAFVCPYLAVVFGSAVALNFATGQTTEPLLWGLFAGALSEIGIEVGWLKLRKK